MKKLTHSIFGQNLLFSVLSILIVGISTIFISYNIQGDLNRKLLQAEAENVASLWSSTFNLDDIIQAQSESDPNSKIQIKLTSQLDLLSEKHKSIEQGYFFLPELNKSGELMIISSSKNLQEAGFSPGTFYLLSDEIKKAYDDSIKTKSASSTEIFTDEYGTWQTSLIPIYNAQEELIAIFGVDIEASLIKTYNKTIVGSLVLAVSLILLVLIIIQYISLKKMLSPFKVILNNIDEISRGNFRVTMEMKRKGEFGQLNNSLKHMVNNLKTLIGQVSVLSDKVYNTSKDLQVVASNTADTSKELSESVVGISSHLKVQMEGSLEGATAMEEIAIGIQKTAESATVVTEKAENTLLATQKGNEYIQKTINQMGTVSNSVTLSASVISQLGDRSKQIEKIITIISNISDQTNLLALNAAIEAARAGEHGKGFAVVADEVRKLAEQSQKSAVEIANLVKIIQNETENAIQSMERGLSEVNYGEEQIQEVGKIFREIVDSTKNVTEQIQDVSAIFEEMSAGSEQVSASLTNSTAIAKESVNSIDIMQDQSINQIEEMKQLKNSSFELEATVEKLNLEIEKFKI
ncbi:methyl-accepting chemotaxis protein [Cytobacillus firmus]|uniref:methyl-accepting chemotaxis protein n=1 Tax=Cytobacillus firmus TaxID=1399 RepID=UPI0018CD9C9F|nr:HAMP domain-containing methyl-accepting chemotaxis protein [Cytobacillus firmus]MBG9587249.1 hypothetical protein [Cytobacillus firmus]